MNDEEVNLSLPIVELEDCDSEFNTIQVDTFIAEGAVSREDRLQELRKRIRTDHLNDRRREQL